MAKGVNRKVDMYDEFLEEMIDFGVKIPQQYSDNPSRLRREELVGIIDSEFPAFTMKHAMLLQLLACREELYYQRQRALSPEKVSPSQTMQHWNEESSNNFKEWYLGHYLQCPLVADSLNKAQRKYALSLAKVIGKQREYEPLLEEAA